MWSNAGMGNIQGDFDLRIAQVSAPQLSVWLGLAWLGLVWTQYQWQPGSLTRAAWHFKAEQSGSQL